MIAHFGKQRAIEAQQILDLPIRKRKLRKRKKIVISQRKLRKGRKKALCATQIAYLRNLQTVL